MNKAVVAVGASLALLGCGTAPTATLTAAPTAGGRPVLTRTSVVEPNRRYYRCTLDAALPFAHAPATAMEIATVAAAGCGRILNEIVAALQAENAGIAFAEDYARIYAETFSNRTIEDVAAIIGRARRNAD